MGKFLSKVSKESGSREFAIPWGITDLADKVFSKAHTTTLRGQFRKLPYKELGAICQRLRIEYSST